MVGDVREAGYKSCVIETEHFTPEQINEVAYSMNLELNFVHNTDMQMDNFERAIESFDNVLARKHDHAFALFFKGKCLEALAKLEPLVRPSASHRHCLLMTRFGTLLHSFRS